MKIAICDDSDAQRRELAAFLAARPELQADVYDTGSKLLQSIQNGAAYDFILLDIRLTDMLGTALAKAIAEHSPGADIVFVSAYPQYATEAFRLRVSHFLVKPLTRDAFLSELDWLIARREKEKACWCVQTKNRLYRFAPAEIVYIESTGRKLNIQTWRERVVVNGKLSDAERALEGYGFRRSHQSFLVNLRHVRQILTADLICEPDFRIPVSARKRTAFLREYTRYLQQRLHAE